jgi:hypothetical protein
MRSEQVVIRSTEPGADELTLRAARWDQAVEQDYDGPDVHIEMRCGGLRAETRLPAYIALMRELPAFFRDMDAHWTGWSGKKELNSPASPWFGMAASHDGLGHVRLEIWMTEGWPLKPRWTARRTLILDVGSTKAISDDLTVWSTAVLGPEAKAPSKES